jgi:hypothetical protein
MTAFVFIPLLAATCVLGLALAAVAAHYFLVVFDSSASGSETIVWPQEPMADWLWKLIYLAWLGGAWMAPLVIAGRLLSHEPWMRFTIVAGSFWLLFPLGILSSQAANSPWVPFWPGLPARLLQRPKATAIFYFLSLPIVVAIVGPAYLIFARTVTSTVLAVAAAPIAAAAYLIYARALGRLGLVLTFTIGGDNEPGSKKRKLRQAPAEKAKVGEHDEQPVFKQPSELPPIETPFEGPVTGYDVRFDDSLPDPQPRTPSRLPIDDDEDLTPFAMEKTQESAVPAPALKPPSPEELALWDDRRKRIKEPSQPFDGSLLRFLGESKTAGAWLILAGGLALLALMIQLMRELRPM